MSFYLLYLVLPIFNDYKCKKYISAPFKDKINKKENDILK